MRRAVTPAVLLLFLSTAALGVKGAAREIAMPFENIERLAKSPVPETPIAAIAEFEIAFEIPPEPEVPATMPPFIDDGPDNSSWDQWKAQAIAALPAELRQDSEHRRAIDLLYLEAGIQSLDEFAADILNPSPVGVLGFTDIDELTAASDLWITLWAEWRAREIASLPEAWRNDPNRLSSIDTTHDEMVKQHRGRPAFEVEYYVDHEASEEFIDPKVDP